MGGPLTPEDIKVFTDHLSKFPAGQQCPVCLGKAWALAGCEISNSFDSKTGMVGVGGPAVPVVVVACSTCGLLRQFAWFIVNPTDKRPIGGAGV